MNIFPDNDLNYNLLLDAIYAFGSTGVEDHPSLRPDTFSDMFENLLERTEIAKNREIISTSSFEFLALACLIDYVCLLVAHGEVDEDRWLDETKEGTNIQHLADALCERLAAIKRSR